MAPTIIGTREKTCCGDPGLDYVRFTGHVSPRSDRISCLVACRPPLPPSRGGGGRFFWTGAAMNAPPLENKSAATAGRLSLSITEGVGHTPLLELRRLAAGLPGRVAVKLETRN